MRRSVWNTKLERKKIRTRIKTNIETMQEKWEDIRERESKKEATIIQ